MQSLVQILSLAIDRFSKLGIDENLLLDSSWVMPSCDVVLRTPDEADRALMLTSQISKAMREKYAIKIELA